MKKPITQESIHGDHFHEDHWKNQPKKLIKFYGKHIEKQQRADNFLDRIRTPEPLEKRQNVGRAKQKSTTQKDQRFSNNNAGRADQKAGHTTNRDLGQDSNIGTTYFTGDNTNKSSTTPHIIQESLD